MPDHPAPVPPSLEGVESQIMALLNKARLNYVVILQDGTGSTWRFSDIYWAYGAMAAMRELAPRLAERVEAEVEGAEDAQGEGGE